MRCFDEYEYNYIHIKKENRIWGFFDVDNYIQFYSYIYVLIDGFVGDEKNIHIVIHQIIIDF